ncbi:MAG: replication-associated recombination protein A [Pseudomonadota bacterium]
MERAEQDFHYQPLADRMRPARLREFIGQAHLLGIGKPLRCAIEEDKLHSMVLWGPPGTGKTTLAHLLANAGSAQFIALSAVLAGVKDIRDVISRAKRAKHEEHRATVLFVDEVHRFNKSQQDAFLPHVEDATFFFIGATTENPSFELNNALLSRLRVYVLKRLVPEDLLKVIDRAMSLQEKDLGGQGLEMAASSRLLLAEAADGDARRALNLLEIAADLAEQQNGRRIITREIVAEVTRDGLRRFDKSGDLYYDQISALHKSVRGSDPDAALYWYCRMLDGGCDPLYIARRLVRMASEDIGNADPRVLPLALNAWDAYQRLGSPEGELVIAQVLVYLACAPKSNALYTAYGKARRDVRSFGTLEVPLHLRNAPTDLVKAVGHGKGYRYDHDEPDAYAAGQRYFPEELGERCYYDPVERGLEIKIREKLARLRPHRYAK